MNYLLISFKKLVTPKKMLASPFIFAFLYLFLHLPSNSQVFDYPALGPIDSTFIVHSVDLSMVFVKGGTFKMGTNLDSLRLKSDLPVHKETVTSFYISRFEITQFQFEKIMGYSRSLFPECSSCPIDMIGMEDVRAFIKRLNQLSGKKYRLPTEIEWEFAARGGNKSNGYVYSGSNDLSKVGWYIGNSGSKLHEVGKLEPNELGLYDMSGNALEITSSISNEPVKDFIYRGGYYLTIPFHCSVFFRKHHGGGNNSFGIRLAHDSDLR